MVQHCLPLPMSVITIAAALLWCQPARLHRLHAQDALLNEPDCCTWLVPLTSQSFPAGACRGPGSYLHPGAHADHLLHGVILRQPFSPPQSRYQPRVPVGGLPPPVHRLGRGLPQAHPDPLRSARLAGRRPRLVGASWAPLPPPPLTPAQLQLCPSRRCSPRTRASLAPPALQQLLHRHSRHHSQQPRGLAASHPSAGRPPRCSCDRGCNSAGAACSAPCERCGGTAAGEQPCGASCVSEGVSGDYPMDYYSQEGGVWSSTYHRKGPRRRSGLGMLALVSDISYWSHCIPAPWCLRYGCGCLLSSGQAS